MFSDENGGASLNRAQDQLLEVEHLVGEALTALRLTTVPDFDGSAHLAVSTLRHLELVQKNVMVIVSAIDDVRKA